MSRQAAVGAGSDHPGLAGILAGNRQWAARLRSRDPDFFQRLVDQQSPRWMWIGCSDSRVPANEIMGLAPGEVFVHRNVANLVQMGDLNCLAALQYAVEALRVEHIIVCGHGNCGGVRAALEETAHGLIDYWIWDIRQTRERHREGLAALAPEAQTEALCELNVLEQVAHLAQSKILRGAWGRSWPVQVHGLFYHLEDGLLRDLGASLGATGDHGEILQGAVRACLAVRGAEAEESGP
ncbi:MAG: carbonic anhydrase [bacterium]|jgi:carbonic anhydrase|nr:carbonic anhydrase [bacterium]